ncbi:hypothetical protein AVEN_162356-1 [Araneus ventricosus]|uniref:Uncharacterized protein n=1 Tax=Araneus ventricosus TaxID=182803 RepID=A0A4Y2U0M9_ARAVE|nr:hypothetical protein AVEN_162356-1 [Araneus ventricosus]
MNWNTHLENQATKAQILHQNFLKRAGRSWDINYKHRLILHKTVFERMMAQAAAVWCLNPNSRLARKLAKIQRTFLLAISGMYRTAPTATLQTILGIPLYISNCKQTPE